MSSELHAWRTQSAEKNPAESIGGAKLVFLTEAMGYLGCESVNQVVSSSAIKKVFVLVRCSGQAEGYTRVAKVVGETIYRHPGRMETWPGDLQQTRYWKILSSCLSPGQDDDAANVPQVTASSGYAQTKLASELLLQHRAVSETGSHHRFTTIKPSYTIWLGTRRGSPTPPTTSESW